MTIYVIGDGVQFASDDTFCCIHGVEMSENVI